MAPQGRAYQEDQRSSLSRKAFQASLWGLTLLTALLQSSNLIPHLTVGWWAWFCTHKGKPHLEGRQPGPLSAWLQFLYKFCWMRATYQLDIGKITGKREVPSSILLPTSPEKEHISFSEHHFLCGYTVSCFARQHSSLWAKHVCCVF